MQISIPKTKETVRTLPAHMMMKKLAVGMPKQEGGANVVDDRCNTHNSMAFGAGERLYDGSFHSYPSRHCHHRRTGQSHSGEEAVVAISKLEFAFR